MNNRFRNGFFNKAERDDKRYYDHDHSVHENVVGSSVLELVVDSVPVCVDGARLGVTVGVGVVAEALDANTHPGGNIKG